jgi:hypothetical protein
MNFHHPPLRHLDILLDWSIHLYKLKGTSHVEVDNTEHVIRRTDYRQDDTFYSPDHVRTSVIHDYLMPLEDDEPQILPEQVKIYAFSFLMYWNSTLIHILT